MSTNKRPPAITASVVPCLVLLCAIGTRHASSAEAQQPSVRVLVDPRVELMSIIFHLAGNTEYNQGRVASYAEDVDAYFGPFRKHPAVQIAAGLRRTRGISYDACMSMAVHLTDAWELTGKVPLSPRPESLDGRWRPDEALAFLKAARQFVKETRFKDFVTRHGPLYETTRSRMATLLEKEAHTDWFDGFFGVRPSAHFTVALGLLNGGQCYGTHCRNGDGTEDLFCILGVWQTDKEGQPTFNRTMLKTVVHEFCHSYANPVIERHAEKLKAAGEKIFPHVEDAMRRQAYANWKTMLYESLVRAATSQYIRQYEGDAAAQAETQNEKARGFSWIEDLSTLLGEYQADRKRYPTMEAFAPRLVAFFDAIASNVAAQATQQPKVVSMIPANGQTDVDPALTKIVVVFDRPMRNGLWSMVGGGPDFPELTGKPSYNAKRTTWSVEVKLKSEWQYHFMLNYGKYQAFQSEDGTPLESVRVTFTTK